MASAPPSAKDLFVLGRISLRPTYGHEIMRTLASSRSDLWAELSDKHVYYILRKLQRDGLITGTSEQDGGRPARHIYSLTAAGCDEFERLMRSAALIESTPYTDFDVVFGMLAYTDRLSPAQKDEVLAARAEHLRSVVAAAEDAMPTSPQPEAVRLSSRVFDKVAAVAQAELSWLDGIIAEIDRDGWPVPPSGIRTIDQTVTEPENGADLRTTRSDS